MRQPKSPQLPKYLLFIYYRLSNIQFHGCNVGADRPIRHQMYQIIIHDTYEAGWVRRGGRHQAEIFSPASDGGGVSVEERICCERRKNKGGDMNAADDFALGHITHPHLPNCVAALLDELPQLREGGLRGVTANHPEGWKGNSD